MTNFPILTLIMAVPVIGAVIILLIPKERDEAIKLTAAASAFIAMLLSIMVFFAYDRVVGGFQFSKRPPGFRSLASAITSGWMASPHRNWYSPALSRFVRSWSRGS